MSRERAAHWGHYWLSFTLGSVGPRREPVFVLSEIRSDTL